MFEDTSTKSTALVEHTFRAEAQPDGIQSLQIGNAVSVMYKPQDGADAAHVVLEWDGGSSSDMLADAVIAVVLQVSIRKLMMLSLNHCTQCLLMLF